MESELLQAVRTTADFIDVILGISILKMWGKIIALETKQKVCCEIDN